MNNEMPDIPTHIYQNGWTWKADYQPKVVDGVTKSTEVVPKFIEDALREIVNAEQYGYAEESGSRICAFCERSLWRHTENCPIAKAEKLLQGVSEDNMDEAIADAAKMVEEL